ncbi:MAG: inorganic phosphate transporter [bacterium]|jgi:PiT family inorganic phosphate transporter
MVETWIIVAAAVFGLYMAWSVGANDVANAMGTSVGSHALSYRNAIILAGIFDFLGAVLVGGHVTKTVSKNIISLDAIPDLDILVLGMLAALFGAAVWLHFASRLGLPVSTSHSIVGAILGFGVVAGGFGAVNWHKSLEIFASWIISPLLGALISFFLFWFLLRRVIATENPVRAIKRIAPYLVFLVGFILSLSIIYKGLANLHLDMPIGNALLISLAVGIAAGFAAKILVGRMNEANAATFTARMRATEKVFAVLQVMTACYVAFAHGANDVANAVGPVAAVVEIARKGSISETVPVSPWLLVLGGVGIVIGLATYGRHVIKTVGQGLLSLRPSRGFAAEFGCATTVLISSKLGLPVSTTHCIVGAIVGVGFARGIGALNMKAVKSIVMSWLWTIPFSAAVTIIAFLIARAIIY